MELKLVSQRDIFNLSFPFIELANDIDVAVLEELRQVTERLIDDPNQNLERQIQQLADLQADTFVNNAQELTEKNLSESYLLGLLAYDDEIEQLSQNPRMQGNPLPEPSFPDKIVTMGVASQLARKKLKDYPRHIMMYGQYEASLKNVIARFKNPYVRSTVQNYRELVRETLQPEFRNGNKLTRIDMSQRILNDFANRGIQTVTFPSGHRMSVEAFAEREARSYINNVSLQANTNRAVERGYDLVRITQYAGASPMCAPHQGNVYSLSGSSDQYPPFSNAVFDGTYEYGSGCFHSFCGHTTNSYIPGVSEGLGPLSNDPVEQDILNRMGERKGNRFIFQAEQQQRKIERQIRMYKRRKAVALTEGEKQKAQKLVRNWQAKQREWLEEHPFLRRQYKREAV